MQQGLVDGGNNSKGVEVGQKRVIKPTRRSNSGYFPFRGEEAIPYESTLERDFLLRTAFSVDVVGIVPQPVEIPFEGVDGRTYTYTPDFLVYYRLGEVLYHYYPKPLLVEVKPEVEWRQHWRSWSAKWKAAGRFAAEQGWVFRIMDESRIRDQALENILYLEQYKRVVRNGDAEAYVLTTLLDKQSERIFNILNAAPANLSRHTLLTACWQLIAYRVLDFDFEQPLTVNTDVWLVKNE